MAASGAGRALRLLVAEELAVPLRRVALVQGDTDVCPFGTGTYGSRSMPDAGQPLRLAAAGARQALAGLAARRWGIPAGKPGVHEGMVTGGPDGAWLAYGELVAGLRQVEVLSAEPPLSDPVAWRAAGHEGHAASRLDVVTGYGSDLQLPGMLHGAMLRPPSPGRELRAADTSQAAALPGVTVVQFRHHLSYLSEAGLDADELGQVTGSTAAALLRAAGLPAA